MKYTNRQIAKAIIRELKFAREIKKIIKEGEGGTASPEEEEEDAAVDASTEPDAEVEEPAEEPTEEPAEEEGTEEELTELTDAYIKKLRNSQATVDQSDVVEMMSMIIDGFGYGNQDKLTILQGIKEATIR